MQIKLTTEHFEALSADLCYDESLWQGSNPKLGKIEKHTAMHGLEQCNQPSHFAYTHYMLCLSISKSIVEAMSLTLGRRACIKFFSFDATLMAASSDP